MVCDQSIPVADLEDCIRRGARGLLKSVTLFDIYTGVGIPAEKKSVAFNLELRSDERNLNHILALLQSELGAVLR